MAQQQLVVQMRFCGTVTILFGVGFFASAVLVSAGWIETQLCQRSPGELGWGLSLSRVLLVWHGAVLIGFGRWAFRGGGRTSDRTGLKPVPATRTSRSEPWAVPMVAALSALALALRLWQLNSCLWLDEIFTTTEILREPIGRIVTMFPSQNQHMFYSVLARGCVVAFGEHAWSVRLPSVMFGTACVPVLFLLGKRLIGERSALLACCLMTVSYHHVWFSQNARGYMGLLFFTLLATWIWIEASRRRSGGWWVLYAATVALGAWMHMTMVFVAIAHAVIHLAGVAARLGGRASRDMNDSRSLVAIPVAAWCLSATLTLQLYALALPEFLESALHEVSLPSEWTQPLWVVRESVVNLAGAGWRGPVLALLGGCVTVLGGVDLWRRDRAAAVGLVLPGVLAGGTMAVLGHNLWPRFFFFCMGFAVLIAVHGIVVMPRILIPRTATPRLRSVADRLGMAMAIVLVFGSIAMLPRVYALPKQDFVGARDFVARTQVPGEAVVAVGLAGKAYGLYYAPHWATAQDHDELERARASCRRLWLVYTLPIEVRAYHPRLWEVVERDFDVIKVFPGTLGDGAVTVCRERPESRDSTQADAPARSINEGGHAGISSGPVSRRVQGRMSRVRRSFGVGASEATRRSAGTFRQWP